MELDFGKLLSSIDSGNTGNMLLYRAVSDIFKQTGKSLKHESVVILSEKNLSHISTFYFIPTECETFYVYVTIPVGVNEIIIFRYCVTRYIIFVLQKCYLYVRKLVNIGN